MNAKASVDNFVAWSPVLLLGALAALTYWLDAQVRPPAPSYDGSTRHDPDIYIESFRAINLDKNGQLRQALTAKVGRHFPDDDSTTFESPHVTFTEPEKPPLNVTANNAAVSGDRENVTFTGNVKAVRDAGSDGDGPIVFTSEYLRVIPKQDKILSDKPVTITDPRGIINATGMDFDNKTKVVRFQSRVSGQFLPPK